ncbi:MAG: DUF1015 domain-containing protein [Clostridiaceae bacterium]|nr:DUF1015 domain-containing protein [Clostridiaceae bacterium]
MAFYPDPILPVAVPEILLPAPGTDLFRWSVIACDQYTSEPEYWNDTERIVGDAPSTLRMVLPEVFLETLSDSRLDEKIAGVNASIDHYLSEKRLQPLPPGFILVDRKTAYAPSRKGLMLALDLERYDFTPGTREPIRATEGTVLSRIPPRLRIRRDASIEIPHVMVLIDDPGRTVIEPALDALSENVPVYDTPLMQDGGHVTGFFCPETSKVAVSIITALRNLLERSEDGFLFAVGDGNHSLATAKTHWEMIRSDIPGNERSCHPARFALVEVVNIHDKGLDFEPIHRVAFGLSIDAFVAYARDYYRDSGLTLGPVPRGQQPDLSDTSRTFLVTNGEDSYVATLTDPPHPLAAGSLQAFLDKITEEISGVRVDYIHGESSVYKLSGSEATGFILPAVSKKSFFASLSKSIVFPRKTFSMGHAQEKRYYMEAKMIRNRVKEDR